MLEQNHEDRNFVVTVRKELMLTVRCHCRDDDGDVALENDDSRSHCVQFGSKNIIAVLRWTGHEVSLFTIKPQRALCKRWWSQHSRSPLCVLSVRPVVTS